jgi:hypothetical protein
MTEETTMPEEFTITIQQEDLNRADVARDQGSSLRTCPAAQALWREHRVKASVTACYTDIERMAYCIRYDNGEALERFIQNWDNDVSVRVPATYTLTRRPFDEEGW